MSRHDFDHAEALAIYIRLRPPKRTYAEVARAVGCSETSVRRWAREERWAAQLAESEQRVVAKALKTREERTAQLLRIYDQAAQLVDDGLDLDDPKLTLEQVFQRFPELYRMMRVETDQATDNMTVVEVQAGFRTQYAVAHDVVFAVAVELFGERKAAELARLFRARFAPAVNEALTLGAGDQPEGS